jgi:hypothetical protein
MEKKHEKWRRKTGRNGVLEKQRMEHQRNHTFAMSVDILMRTKKKTICLNSVSPKLCFSVLLFSVCREFAVI